MSFLGWLFLESTLALGALLFVFLFFMLVHWRRTLRGRPFAIGVMAALALLLTQALVVTKREHAERIMNNVEAALLTSSPDGIAAELSADFKVEVNDWDKEDFIEVVRSYIAWLEINSLRRRRLEIIEDKGERFLIYVSFFADVKTRNFAWVGLSRWRIEFVLDEAGWRIIAIEPTEIGQQPVRSWRGVPPPR